MFSWSRIVFTILTLALLKTSLADEHNHVYKEGEEVIVWMNTVGPLHNRQETYPYFQLPFCQGPHSVEHHHETLGEALLGMDLVNSGIPTQFKINEADKAYCKQELEPKDVDVLRYAVDNQYWYTMFIDDLPVSGVVGKDEEEEQATETDPHAKKLYVYTHKSFMFEYNGNQIISISLKHGNLVELKHGLSSLTFTYSVTWNPTDVLFENRFERLLEADFFEHKVSSSICDLGFCTDHI
ncbi:hypothetical protein RMATCC62417_04418 [Rhizopus microsporus]|nr:hypothetical protein RMATCC62417_04418 [Rhizopus microsporus]